MNTNECVPEPGSFDDCDASTLLEDLKFRNTHSSSKGRTTFYRGRSSTVSILTTSSNNAETELYSQPSGTTRSSFSGRVSARVRDSFCKIASSSTCKTFIEGDARTFSIDNEDDNSKVQSMHNRVNSFSSSVVDTVDLPCFDENGAIKQGQVVVVDPTTKTRCNSISGTEVTLMWMMPQAEFV